MPHAALGVIASQYSVAGSAPTNTVAPTLTVVYPPPFGVAAFRVTSGSWSGTAPITITADFEVTYDGGSTWSFWLVAAGNFSPDQTVDYPTMFQDFNPGDTYRVKVTASNGISPDATVYTGSASY